MQNGQQENILKSFPKKDPDSKSKNQVIIASFMIVLLGLGAGYFLSKMSFSGGTLKPGDVTSSDVTITENEAGMGDDSSFPDVAEGILVEGGVKGEGTHHLERPGGESQNVYLTSTVINLQSFVGKKVEVRGLTLSAINAGWLMDVGKVKVVN
jgi:hypothetical protein